MKNKFKTPDFVKKRGIVLSPEMMPYESALTFNAGITRWQGRYVMLFRNDYGFCSKDFDDFYAGISDNTTPSTNIGAAFSDDGVNWEIMPEPVFSLQGNGISRVYDPRITILDESAIVCFAVQGYGTRGGVAVTKDFKNFEVKSISLPENRNMVIFPEKINGEYCRLERPFLTGKGAHPIWLSRSRDLEYWGKSELVLSVRDLPYANLKIGPGAPPVKTPYGWLTLIHGVATMEKSFSAWERNWNRCYYAGVMLLDLENPAKVLAVADRPLLVPEEDYELTGFRGGVIFPGGAVPEADGTLKIYYGAADTVECLAEAKIDDLIDFCFTNNVLRGNFKTPQNCQSALASI